MYIYIHLLIFKTTRCLILFDFSYDVYLVVSPIVVSSLEFIMSKLLASHENPKAISKSNLLQKVGYFSWPLLKVPADFKLSELGNTHGMELISSWDHSSVIGRKQDFCVNIVLISCKTFTISLVFNLKNFKSFTTVSFCNEISFPKFPLVSNQTHRQIIPLPYTI